MATNAICWDTSYLASGLSGKKREIERPVGTVRASERVECSACSSHIPSTAILGLYLFVLQLYLVSLSPNI